MQTVVSNFYAQTFWMKRAFITLLLFIFSLSISAETVVDKSVQPIDLTYLQGMVKEVNLKPLQSYQRLLAYEKTNTQLAPNEKLWLLVRKAQSENLLYFYPDFEKTVNLAQSLITTKTPKEIVISLNFYSSIILRRQANLIQATKLLESSLEQAKKYNFQNLAVLIKYELAYTYGINALFEMSLSDLQEGYVEAFTLKDDYLIALINEVYGAIYGYMNDYERSIEYYQKALNSYQQLGYPYNIAETVYGMATTYRDWEKWDLAIEKYKQYGELVQYSPNKEVSFYSAYGVGMTLSAKGDCAKAIPAIDKALTFEGILDFNAELYKRKAKCLIEAKKFSQAEVELNKAEAIFASLTDLDGTSWHLEVIKIRSQLAHGKNENDIAYTLLNDYSQKYIEFILKNSTNSLLKLKKGFEIDRKNVEISLLEQQNKVHVLQVEQQQQRNIQQRYIIFIAILFIVFILVIMFIQQRNNRKVIALSVRDPLSDLFNRRYIFSYLHKIIKATDPKKGDVSVMLIDIDDFKEINDQYGHPFGDEVIRQMAKIGQETLRIEDMMGRIGGEEFLCTLPRIDTEQCLIIATRFVENVRNHIFETPDKQRVKITVSIGVTSTSETVTECNSLYIQADKALYHAKNKGKDGVSQYHSYMKHAYESRVEVNCNPDEIS